MKKRNFKKLFTLPLSLAAVLAVASCGDDGTNPEPDTPQVLEYNVVFNTNGGSAVSTKVITNGSTVTKPTDPTKSGYNFGGWYSDEACTSAFDFTTVITSNTTLYAKWTVITYTVSFNTAYGSAADVTDVTALPDTLPTLTQDGYTFEGWYTDEAYTTQAVAGSAITANTTLYAKWTPVTSGGSENNNATTIFSEDFSTTTLDDLVYGTGDSTGCTLNDGKLTILGSEANKCQVKFTFDEVSTGVCEIKFDLSVALDASKWSAFEILDSTGAKIVDLRCTIKKQLGFRINNDSDDNNVIQGEANSFLAGTTYSFKVVVDYTGDNAMVSVYLLNGTDYTEVLTPTQFAGGAVSAVTFGLGSKDNRDVTVDNILVTKSN